jgi:hypothetical protein
MLQPSNGLNNIEMKYESWRILNIADAMGKFRRVPRNNTPPCPLPAPDARRLDSVVKENVPDQILPYVNANLCGAPFDDPAI